MKRHPLVAALLLIVFGFGYFAAFSSPNPQLDVPAITIVLLLVVGSIYLVSSVRSGNSRKRSAKFIASTALPLLPQEVVEFDITALNGRIVLTDRRVYLAIHDRGGLVMFWQLPDVISIRSSISPRGGMITVQAPSVSDQHPAAFNLAMERSQMSEASEMIDHFYQRKAGAPI